MMKKLLILLAIPIQAFAMHFSVFPKKFDCPEINNSMQCARYIENRDVLNDKRIIRVSDSELHVKISEDDVRIFKDRSDSKFYDENASFTAIEILKSIDYLLIHRQFWEGNAYSLLNLRTGQETKVWGYASVSPDNGYIVVAEMDLMANYSPNVLQVYKVASNGLVLFYDAKPEGWAPDDVTWSSEHQISFKKTEINPDINSMRESDLYLRTPAKISINESGATVSLNKASHQGSR